MSAADDALRAIMDAIEIDTVAEVSAVHFTPVGLADLAGALADMIEAARAEGEAAGYRRAIDDACALLDEEQLRAWATSVSPRNDSFADGVRHAMFEVRALAPVEPVSSADGLLGTAT